MTRLQTLDAACGNRMPGLSIGKCRIEAVRLGDPHCLGVTPSQQRLAEFQAGRSCAELAMRPFGPTSGEVLSGARGEPVWPPDIVGSISHCRKWAVAVAAPSLAYSGVGIDCELIFDDPLAAEVAPLIASESELRAAKDALGEARLALTFLFSAKESIYKSMRRALPPGVDFLDAEVRAGNEGFFAITWRRQDCSKYTGEGRTWLLDGETVLTLFTSTIADGPG